MAARSLPLHCTICTKKPTFSDVSHLLTHVSSKGHLSTYYKIKVRASSDQASRDLIDVYDNWYIGWGIEALMSERMHHKDNRSSRPRPSARPPKVVQARTVARTSLDPVLTESLRRHTDAELASSLEPLLASMPNFQSRETSRPSRPKLHLWSTMRPSSVQAVPLESSTPMYSSQRVPHWPADDIAPPQSQPQQTSRAPSLTQGPREYRELVNGSSKLKGVYWPGMDIFDAASSEMRRKRNQKKDVSVVEQLQQNSLEVQPTEMVFTSNGSFKKARQITGQVDPDSSPILSAQAIPMAQQRRYRPALLEKDVNSICMSQSALCQSFGTKLKRPSVKVESTIFSEPTRGFSVPSDHLSLPQTCNEEFDLKILNTGYPLAAFHNTTGHQISNGDPLVRSNFHCEHKIFPDATGSAQDLYTQPYLFEQSQHSYPPAFNEEDGPNLLRDLQAIGREALGVDTDPDYNSPDSLPAAN